jgi:hypothetical protein
MTPDMFQVAFQAAAVLGVFLTAVGSFIGVLVSLRNGRMAHAIALRTEQNATAIHRVQVEVNGRLTELLRVSIALARTEGAMQGRGEALAAAGAIAMTAAAAGSAAVSEEQPTQ